MVKKNTNVNVAITGDAKKFKRELSKAERSLGAFGKKATSAGKSLSTNLTLPMVAAGAAALKSAIGFESSMTKIQSLVGLSAEAVAGFAEDVKGLAGETARAPQELADAMFFVTSAGLRGAEATEVLEASAKAAAVGLGETAVIADLATSALNAYGAENLSATDATDVLTAAVREGKLDASELAASMGSVLPVASAMGVNFNEVGAAFAAMSRTGTNAAEAATQIRAIMVTLLKPSVQADKALADMGLSAAELRTQMREKGLLSTLQTLADEFDGNSEAAAAVFGNVRALVGVMDLMGSGAETTADIFSNMADVTGTLDEAFGITADTAEFKLNQAMTDIKLSFQEVGEALIPVVIPAIQALAGWIKDLADRFSNLTPFMQNTVLVIAGITAVAGPLLIVAGKISLAFKSLSIEVTRAKVAMAGFYAAAAIAIALPLFLWWKNNAEAAAEAKDRQEKLNEAMIEAADPAATLVDRVKALNAEYRDLTGAAEGAEGVIDGFVGDDVLTEMLIALDVLGEFNDLDFDSGKIGELLATGTDGFENLADAIGAAGVTSSKSTLDILMNLADFSKEFNKLDEPVKEVAQALVDAYLAGEITGLEFQAIALALDETADAFDDNEETIEENSKALLKNVDEVNTWTDALGDQAIAIIDAGLKNGNYSEAVDELNGLMEIQVEEVKAVTSLMHHQTIAEEKRANASFNFAESLEGQAAAQEAVELAADQAAKALQEEEKAFNDFVASIKNAFDPINSVEKAQDSLWLSIQSFKDALIASGGELKGFSDEIIAARGEMFSMEDAFSALIAEVFANNGTVDEAAEQFELWKDAIIEAAIAADIAEDDLAELRKELDLLADMSEIGLTIRVNEIFEQTGISMTGLTGSQGSEMMNILTTTGVTSLVPMAEGGIVTGPTPILAGEAGPEAIIPLDGNHLGGTNYITINVQGVSGEEVIEAIQRETRQRGAAVFPTVGTRRL